MKSLRTIAMVTIASAAFVAVAHEGHDHNKSGPVRMEQKPWGIAGKAGEARRTIELRMSDAMRFSPDRIEVKQGEVVKFVVRNSGKMLHEIVIGTRKDLDEHADLMMKFPNMEHDEPYMAHVKPGTTAELVWNFNRPGEFDFACLIAGHYQAGMVGKIRVVASSQALTSPENSPPARVRSVTEMTEGEVRKVDIENKKITLKHGEIKNLDMPAMTMVFQVKNPSILDKVKAGDKIRFRAVNENGKLTVTEVQAAK